MLRTPGNPIKLQEKIGTDLVKSADLTIAYMCAECAFDTTKEMPRKIANAWKIMNAMSVDSLAGYFFDMFVNVVILLLGFCFVCFVFI